MIDSLTSLRAGHANGDADIRCVGGGVRGRRRPGVDREGCNVGTAAPEGNTVISSVAVVVELATDVAVTITRVLLVTLLARHRSLRWKSDCSTILPEGKCSM